MRAYEEALKLRPGSERAHANTGNILQESGDLEGAAKCYERALELAPSRPETLWNLAVVRELQGDGAAAERSYGQLISQSPDWEEAWFRIGCLRLQRGEFQGSVEAFREAVKRRPDHSPSLINGALACWCLDDLGSAREMFQRALALDPDCQVALRALATLAMHANEPEHGLAYCDALSKIGDSTAELRYNLALLFQESGDAGQAANLYRAALAENPEFPEALVNLGHALETLGQSEEARRCWAEALRQKPELAAT
jgi:tetratricopeptide (TPR) repeat protein